MYEINEISWDFRQKFLSVRHMLQNCLILLFSHKNLQTIIFFHILEYLNYTQLNFDGRNMCSREYKRPEPLFATLEKDARFSRARNFARAPRAKIFLKNI